MNLRFPHTNDFDGDAAKWLKHRDEKLAFIFNHVTDWGCALDCGAWAGWWTNKLAELFTEVWAFEPVAVNAAFCRINNPARHVHIIEAAITDHVGAVPIQIGGAHYGRVGKGDLYVPCTTVDTFGLSPGFIKLDLEGQDYQGLLGAEKTIERSHPVICIETKDYKDHKIQEWLTAHGYIMAMEYKPDEVWVYANNYQ